MVNGKTKVYVIVPLLAALLLAVSTLGSATAQGPADGRGAERIPVHPVGASPQSRPPVAAPGLQSAIPGQPTSHALNSETVYLGEGRYQVRIAGGPRYYRHGDRIAQLEAASRSSVLTYSRMVEDPTARIRPPAGDALIWSGGPDTNWGSTPELWVDDADRSLVVWDLSSLPERAMIYDSEALLQLVDSQGPDMDISIHRVTSAWTESGVSWNSRNGRDDWGTPGGDFDPSAEDVVRVGTVTDTLWSWVLPDLVAEWHSERRSNYGVLLQPESYPAPATKVFAAKEGSDPPPELSVSYTLGPVELFPYMPFVWGVPSPDWYSYSQDARWNGVAMRPPTGADYDLWLCETDEYAYSLTKSVYGGDAVDYVLVDGNHAPQGSYYPKVTQWGGRGWYRIEHAAHTAGLSVGCTAAYTVTRGDVMRVWDVELDSGATYDVSVEPVTGDADLIVALHRSEQADSATWYQGRASSVGSADDAGPGAAESFSYTAPASDWFGLIVVSKGATTDTSYRVCVEMLDTQPPSSSANSPDYCNAASVPVTWTASDDVSGVDFTALWAKFGSDGTWADTGLTQSGISGTFDYAPGEGDGTYYFGTVATDNAGHVEAAPTGSGDDSTVYDTTAPSSSATSPDYDNAGGIPVTWSASDGLSGVAETSLWYKFGTEGTWTDSSLTQSGISGTFDFTPPGGGNGTYYFAARAQDNAGNVEGNPDGSGDDSTVFDTVPPTASATCPSRTSTTSFTVGWTGDDGTSGVREYDVQYRVAADGTWTTWKAGVTETSATFGPHSPVTVEDGQIYYFRARARDWADNTGQYAAGDGDCSTQVGGEISRYLPLVVCNRIAYAAPCGPANDYCEDHDTVSRSYGPLEPGVGYRAYPDDADDFYYILLTGSASAAVQVTDYQAVGQLLVYDEDLNTLGMDWNDPGDDGVMTVAALSLGAGKYYIRVYTGSGWNVDTLYTLTVSY